MKESFRKKHSRGLNRPSKVGQLTGRPNGVVDFGEDDTDMYCLAFALNDNLSSIN
jgi:hypothetical protein